MELITSINGIALNWIMIILSTIGFGVIIGQLGAILGKIKASIKADQKKAGIGQFEALELELKRQLKELGELRGKYASNS